jgi:hypothetical protein
MSVDGWIVPFDIAMAAELRKERTPFGGSGFGHGAHIAGEMKNRNSARLSSRLCVQVSSDSRTAKYAEQQITASHLTTLPGCGALPRHPSPVDDGRGLGRADALPERLPTAISYSFSIPVKRSCRSSPAWQIDGSLLCT